MLLALLAPISLSSACEAIPSRFFETASYAVSSAACVDVHACAFIGCTCGPHGAASASTPRRRSASRGRPSTAARRRAAARRGRRRVLLPQGHGGLRGVQCFADQRDAVRGPGGLYAQMRQWTLRDANSSHAAVQASFFLSQDAGCRWAAFTTTVGCAGQSLFWLTPLALQ
jgi:hypothetical protein